MNSIDEMKVEQKQKLFEQVAKSTQEMIFNAHRPFEKLAIKIHQNYKQQDKR